MLNAMLSFRMVAQAQICSLVASLFDVFCNLPCALCFGILRSFLVLAIWTLYPAFLSIVHDMPRWFSGIIRPSGFLIQELTSLSMGEVPRSIRGWGLFGVVMSNTVSSSVSE